MTKEVLKLALEALEAAEIDGNCQYGATEIIRKALAQPAQEPVAWLLYNGERKESFWMDKGDAYDLEMRPEHRWEPLYTTLPQRPWVELTDEEIDAVCAQLGLAQLAPRKVARAVLAKSKEKNNG